MNTTQQRRAQASIPGGCAISALNMLSSPTTPVRRTVVVDVSSMATSTNPNDLLITYSLGSCLGVAIYDPVARVGGMLHAMLPLSRVAPDKARSRPCMFVDSGMTAFLERLFELGLRKSRAVVKLAGASRILDRNAVFDIGRRNHTVCRKLLWKNEMLMAAQDVGGSVSRTIGLEIGTGRFFVKSQGKTQDL